MTGLAQGQVATVAELKAWRTGIVLDVVDKSLAASARAREQAAAERAVREAEEARARQSEEEMMLARAREEAEDAARLAAEQRSRERAAERAALLTGEIT